MSWQRKNTFLSIGTRLLGYDSGREDYACGKNRYWFCWVMWVKQGSPPSLWRNEVRKF